MTTATIKHKHWELAKRAHSGTSFSPEKRADQECIDFDSDLASDLEKVTAVGGNAEEYTERYNRLWTAWMSAKSRCISTMITGPANFPVRRAQKANESEHKRYEEFAEFRKNYIARCAKAARKAAAALLDPVAEISKKIEEAELMQERMKAANKLVKSKKKSDVEKVEELIGSGWSASISAELVKPDWCGRIGFATYQLTNNLANIKRMKERLGELQKKASAESTETERSDGIRIFENVEADRIQLFFPGKPEAAMISSLKSRGFKWSPSNGCWQRQLTDNARYAVKQILPEK